MSDDDDFMNDNSGSDDFDFDDSDNPDDGGSQDEGDVDLENTYYNAKQYKEDEPDTAFDGFQEVVEKEGFPPPSATEKSWGFRALKQMIKLNFKLGNYHAMMEKYHILLNYVRADAVPKSYSEKSINNLMDVIASASSDTDAVTHFFEATLVTLQEAKNDRLWFKAKKKLGEMFLNTEDYLKLDKTLRELESYCKGGDGKDDPKKGTQMFEIFSLKFPMLTAQKRNKELRKEYRRALDITSAIPHPMVMGIIRECGGKMHLAEESWKLAYEDFFEAFKNYDEAGNPRRLNCLKLLVLANMLMKSTIDPFEAQESKPYKEHPDVKAMTDLVRAYQTHHIKDFEKIIRLNRKTLMDDPWISESISDLLRNIRTEVMIKLIKPYTRIRIPFIAQQLNISVEEVESLLVGCILDGALSGQIDQINQLFILSQEVDGGERYSALANWSKHLKKAFQTVSNNKLS